MLISFLQCCLFCFCKVVESYQRLIHLKCTESRWDLLCALWVDAILGLILLYYVQWWTVAQSIFILLLFKYILSGICTLSEYFYFEKRLLLLHCILNFLLHCILYKHVVPCFELEKSPVYSCQLM